MELFAHLVNKADGTLKDFNSVYCNNCLQSSDIKTYKNIVSTKNLSQHFECLVKMRATSSTLFVRVYIRVTENAGTENARVVNKRQRGRSFLDLLEKSR